MAEQLVLLLKLDDGTVKETLVSVEKKSKKTAGNIEKRFSKVGSSLKRSLVGIGTALVAAFAGRKVIEAAQTQENAINQLNKSLQNAGTFSAESSRNFQVFASELQQVTAIGDETTLQLAALARQFTKTDEEARALTEASIDLSAATGLSLEGSVKNLGKTFSGLTGELGESVSEIRNLTAAQLKAGLGIDIVAKKFKGFASAQASTTSGQLRLLSANFGDLLENIGNALIASPKFTKALDSISDSIISINDAISDKSGTPAFIRNLQEQRSLLEIERINLEATIGRTEDKIANSTAIVGTRLSQGLEFSRRKVEELAGEIDSIDEKLRISQRNAAQNVGGLSPQDQAKRIQFQQILGQATSARIQAELQGIKQLSGIEAQRTAQERILSESKLQVENDFQTKLQAIRQQYNERKIVSQTELNNLEVQLEQSKNLKLQALQQQLGQSTDLNFSNIKDATVSAFQGIEVSAESVGQTLSTTFVSGFSKAFGSIGTALGKGQNAFEAFGDSIFQTIGGLASQLGQFFILVGIGISSTASLLGLSGGSAIAAGVALQIFGGFLSSLGGGGGDVAGAGGAGGDSGGGESDATVPTVDDIENQRQSVVVNIKGDVLDSRETGIRISEILQENFSAEGVEVVRG